MKKFLLILLLVPSVAFGQVSTAQLMGVGVPAAQASLISSIADGTGPIAATTLTTTGSISVLTNNTPIRMLDQTAALHDVMLVDAGGNTCVIAPTGEFIELTIADTVVGSVGATGIAVAGVLSATSTITSSRTTDLGWAVVSAANTACNTTCTFACVFGVNTASATADIVGCADATADKCLCAGAN